MWLALLSGLLTAQAQEPMVFSLDPVFVSRFETGSPDVERDARVLRAALEAYLSERFLVVPIDQVAPFDDYTAETYLEACLPDQYVACAFVIGERAEAEWSVVAHVDRADDGALAVKVTYIDVARSQILLSFDAVVTEDNEGVFLEGVAGVLDKMILGEGESEDVRGEITDPAELAEQRSRQVAMAALSLQELERQLGVMVERGQTGSLDRPKITLDDLSEYDDRDDEAPWVRLDMSREEYVRYKNSGRNLFEWRSLRTGRARRVLLRVGGGMGAGPFHQVFDGRYALDDETLQVVEVDQFQEAQAGSGGLAELEVGFGILPTVDLSFVATTRSATYSYLFYQEVEGDPGFEPHASQLPVASWQIGGRASFVPLPTSSVRPTVTGGVGVWTGRSVDTVIDPPDQLTPLPPPKIVFLEALAGAEATLSEQLMLYARGGPLLRVSGGQLQQLHEGSQVLFHRGTPEGGLGGTLGGQLSVGVVVRLAPFGVPDGEPDPAEEEWEPDF